MLQLLVRFVIVLAVLLGCAGVITSSPSAAAGVLILTILALVCVSAIVAVQPHTARYLARRLETHARGVERYRSAWEDSAAAGWKEVAE